jgi:adhesin HecA-like repeat protein
MGMLPQVGQQQPQPQFTAGQQIAPMAEPMPQQQDPGLSRADVSKRRAVADSFASGGMPLESVRNGLGAAAYALRQGLSGWTEGRAKDAETKQKAADRKALADALNSADPMSALSQLDIPEVQDMMVQSKFAQMSKAPAEKWNDVDTDKDGVPDAQRSSTTGEYKTIDRPRSVEDAIRIAREGRSVSTTNVNMGGTEKQIYDTIAENYKQVAPVVGGLASLREARKLVNAGGMFGAGADLRVGAAKVLSLLTGAPVDPKVVNTESFAGAISPLVGATLKATSGTSQLSEGELKFAQRAAAGDINLDQKSIETVLAILEKAMVNSAASHNRKLDAVYPKGQGADRERQLFEIDVRERSKTKDGRPISRMPGGNWEFDE